MEIQLAQTLHRAGLQHSNQTWEMALMCSGRSTQKRLGLATWPASGEAVGQFREWLEGSVKNVSPRQADIRICSLPGSAHSC